MLCPAMLELGTQNIHKLKPLNEVITKATKLTEGRRSDFFNHLKAAADSLSALAWIAYTGKDCGK